MPALTLPLRNQEAVVGVAVGVSSRRELALRRAGLPVPAAFRGTGLIDTGAAITCLDPSVRQALGLTRVGTVLVAVPAAGTRPRPWDRYRVRLTVLHPSGDPQEHLMVNDLVVAEMALGQTGTDMLLGCDLLARCLFQYDGRQRLFSLDYT